jgi:hypothetical protein
MVFDKAPDGHFDLVAVEHVEVLVELLPLLLAVGHALGLFHFVG